MAKKGMKTLACILCALLALTSFGGCKHDPGIEVDVNKSQLYIGTYGGGYGTAFLEDLKVRFEEYAKDISFQEGKTGVQVFYQEDKDKFNASTLVDTISYDTNNELYFLNGDELNDFLSGNKILEITEAITTPLTEFGEDKSIEDKLRTEMKSHHNRNGKYYSLPFTESTLGIVYDVDVFEENELYLAKNGAPSEALQEGGSFTRYQWVGATGARSAGPDGKYETEYDNGLPATLEEFEQLIDRMDKKSVDSIIWTGQYADTYTSFLPRAFHTNYHGVDESSIVIDGKTRETRLITSFNGNTPVVEMKSVGLSNIKDLAKQAGYYYGLKMFEIMLASDTVSDYAYQDLSHVRTQEKFLISNHRFGETPIAFMIDGAWWENEADAAGTFKDNVTEFGQGAARSNRRFGLFPMPNATTVELQDRINGRKGTINGGGGSIVVNANVSSDKIDLIYAFLRFCITDESLNRFTVKTSLPSPYKYELKDEYIEQMTYFAKNYWEIYTNSDLFYSDLEPAEFEMNLDLLNVRDTVRYQTSVDAAEGNKYGLFPTEVEYNGVTAKDYFNGIYRGLA